MQTSKKLSIAAWTLLALAFVYHILYTAGPLSSTQSLYSIIMLTLLAAGTVCLFSSFYSRSKSIPSSVLKTIMIIIPLLIIGYIIIFIIGLSVV